MRKGKVYEAFPGYEWAPNSLPFFGLPYNLNWSIYVNGPTPPLDLFVQVNNADLALDETTGKALYAGDFSHSGRVYGCELWTMLLPGSPAVEIGVHVRRDDGVTFDVRSPRVLSEVGLWSGGGGFVDPTPAEWQLPPPYVSVRFIGIRPVQRREQL